LSGRQLRVQSGKGDRDRVIPMSDQLVTVLQNYLMVREPASTDREPCIIQKLPNTDKMTILSQERHSFQTENLRLIDQREQCLIIKNEIGGHQ